MIDQGQEHSVGISTQLFPRSGDSLQSESPNNSAVAEKFKDLRSGVNAIFQTKPPELWWKGVYKLVREISSDESRSPEIQAFIRDYGSQVKDVLENELHTRNTTITASETPEEISQWALSVIHEVS